MCRTQTDGAPALRDKELVALTRFTEELTPDIHSKILESASEKLEICFGRRRHKDTLPFHSVCLAGFLLLSVTVPRAGTAKP